MLYTFNSSHINKNILSFCLTTILCSQLKANTHFLRIKLKLDYINDCLTFIMLLGYMDTTFFFIKKVLNNIQIISRYTRSFL